IALDWLRNISAARAPISFEIIGHRRRATIRVTADVRDAEHLREQTRAFFPAVSLRAARHPLDAMWYEVGGEIVGAIEFGLAREFMLPLTEPSDKTPLLRPFLAAIGLLGEEDIAVFQVLFTPAQSPWGP